jgi:tRNA U34 5-carboxymethylaminomethyl modifying GTPase MnmE/TrmE
MHMHFINYEIIVIMTTYLNCYCNCSGGIRSAVAIVRVSGSSAGKVLQDIGRFKMNKFPRAREVTVKKLYDVRNASLIDHAVIVWFPGKIYVYYTCIIHVQSI